MTWSIRGEGGAVLDDSYADRAAAVKAASRILNVKILLPGVWLVEARVNGGATVSSFQLSRAEIMAEADVFDQAISYHVRKKAEQFPVRSARKFTRYAKKPSLSAAAMSIFGVMLMMFIMGYGSQSLTRYNDRMTALSYSR